jgi:cysteine-rich repeat protein
MKKKHKKILNVLLIVLGIFLIAYLRGVFSIVDTNMTIRTFESTTILPIQTGTFNFNSYSGTYETLFLGSVSCSGNPGTYYCYIAPGRTSDEDDSFSNSIQGGDTLTLSSSASGYDRFTNYISTKLTLPAGKITADYNYNLYSHEPCSDTQITFRVGNNSKSFKVGCGGGKDYYSTNSSSFEVILMSEQEVDIAIISSVSNDHQNSEGSLIITYNPEETTIEIYRLEENKCNFYTIEKINKLETDHLSLSECENDIIITPCGNGVLESKEECDDGNTISEDGCSSICQKEDKPNYWVFISIIGGLIVFIVVLIFILKRFKR